MIYKIVIKILVHHESKECARDEVLHRLMPVIPPDWEFTVFETRELRQKGRKPKRISTK